MKTYHPICRWESNQRTRYRQGRLSVYRIQKLERIPNWRWDYSSDYLPFSKAKKYVKSLRLKNQREWRAARGTLPKNVPRAPETVYSEWVSLGDWLGTNFIAMKYRKDRFWDFKKARKYVRCLKIQSFSKWVDYCSSGKRPLKIPSNPCDFYKTEWNGWADWLGTINLSACQISNQFWNFKKARRYARSLKFKSVTQWRAYVKTDLRPKELPSCPNEAYELQWISWSDWLGHGVVSNKEMAKNFYSFKKARTFVRSFKMNCAEWKIFKSSEDRPSFIPSNPNRTYKTEWISWKDFLGTSCEL